MYSRCPNCNKQIKVSARQLRVSRGLLKCKRCGESFDALALLSETADEVQTKSRTYSGSEARQSPWLWGLASLLMFMVLLAQIVYFDGRRLVSQPTINLALSKACGFFNCSLPVINIPDEWAVSHTELEPHMNNRYWVIAALTNQAGITQAFPELKLRLTDFNGQLLAERVFSPHQYSVNSTLASNETVLVRLPLVMTANEIGGFTLETL